MLKRACVMATLLTAGACSGGNSSTSPSPTAAALPFTMSGQVTDRATGGGISGATVSIPNNGSQNAGKSTITDAAGHYSLAGLQPPLPGVARTQTVVNITASNYAPQTEDVTFVSNQPNLTVSFQLIPANTIITFAGLTAIGSAVTTYSESGFTVSTSAGSWTVDNYGNPSPSISFSAPTGSTAIGTIQVTAGGAAFSFGSVDLYSDTTPIPYVLTGLRHSTTIFTLAATTPNPFGSFVTVVNPEANVIDTLVITLSNSAASSNNSFGVDNIALTK
jgi:hypothetical protein